MDFGDDNVFDVIELAEGTELLITDEDELMEAIGDFDGDWWGMTGYAFALAVCRELDGCGISIIGDDAMTALEDAHAEFMDAWNDN